MPRSELLGRLLSLQSALAMLDLQRLRTRLCPRAVLWPHRLFVARSEAEKGLLVVVGRLVFNNSGTHAMPIGSEAQIDWLLRLLRGALHEPTILVGRGGLFCGELISQELTQLVRNAMQHLKKDFGL